MRRLWISLCVVLCAAPPCMCGDALYRVIDTSAAPGETGVRLPIAAVFPVPTQGFSLALRHECSACVVRGATVADTFAFEADFVSCVADDRLGTAVVGVLMESTIPASGKMLPALPDPAPVVALELDVASDAVCGEYRVRFDPAGLPSGSAWIFNAYAALNESYRITDLREGVLTLSDKPKNGIPRFVRGDANQDLLLDLGDAIYILQSLYLLHNRPPCIDACDTNDDGKIDVADPIYLLSFLFARGPRPPIPGVAVGIDWTPDPFDCDDPVAGYMTDFWPE